ncbi:hypothetical protein Sgou_33210 [Streptomyces gougerotii]|uniref:Uncharacterized protein n=1 Tax=Streptomyces gougerotii TaxID=53448 RepID=A0A8H9LN36_9ACTN|nr:hypothetical protein Sgou_33210 [Streptomyces gougerotii]GGU85181.1 hypothetical protein GCM10010227_44400 [Streptomyces gougerotii]
MGPVALCGAPREARRGATGRAPYVARDLRKRGWCRGAGVPGCRGARCGALWGAAREVLRTTAYEAPRDDAYVARDLRKRGGGRSVPPPRTWRRRPVLRTPRRTSPTSRGTCGNAPAGGCAPALPTHRPDAATTNPSRRPVASPAPAPPPRLRPTLWSPR